MTPRLDRRAAALTRARRRRGCCRSGAAPSRRRKRRPRWLAARCGRSPRRCCWSALPAALVVWVLHLARASRSREVVVEGGTRACSAAVGARGRSRRSRGAQPGAAAAGRRARRGCAAHPWVATVELRRSCRDRLRVAVDERQPVALLRQRGGGSSTLDADGPSDRAGRRPSEARRTELLRGSLAHPRRSPAAGAGARARRGRASSGAAQPAWGAALSRSRGARRAGLPPPHRGAAVPAAGHARAGAAEGADACGSCCPSSTAATRRSQAVDLRFSRRIVVQPAAPKRRWRHAGRTLRSSASSR